MQVRCAQRGEGAVSSNRDMRFASQFGYGLGKTLGGDVDGPARGVTRLNLSAVRGAKRQNGRRDADP